MAIKIHFDLSMVECISVDDFDVSTTTPGLVVDLQKPMTKVVMKNTQPVYIDPDMVGYVRNDTLTFEK